VLKILGLVAFPMIWILTGADQFPLFSIIAPPQNPPIGKASVSGNGDHQKNQSSSSL
jgi:hypothetical protein